MVGRDPPRIAFYNPFVSDVEWVVGSFRAEENCRALSRLGVTGIVASPFLSHERELCRGFRWVPLPLRPFKRLEAFLNIVRGGDFDIVQERPFYKGFFRDGFGLAASLDRGIPLVIELHNIGTPMSYVRRLPIHVPMLWRSSLVLSYGDVSRRFWFGADKGKTVAVPNGFSNELVQSVMNGRDGQFDLREVTRGRKAFGFFGRLSAAKGVDILLDVAEELRPRGDICFLFAGTGNLVDRVTEAANRPESNVAYLGILDRRDALSCISQCRSTFAVYDSQQSAFGNPVKIAESIALGAPVIVNDGLGVPDGLRPHCIVVRGRSSSEIADVVARVADSGDRMQVPAGIEDFSIEAIVEKIVLPAYMRLLRL